MTVLDGQVMRLLGLDESTLTDYCGQRLQPEAAAAFVRLAEAAQEQGFDLRAASAFRSFARQRRIWNRKLRGESCVVDDRDEPIDLFTMDVEARLHCVLRFSALPGASRHHWGTDVDVYDAAAVAADYSLQLSAAEVASGGVFARLHEWLDERIASGASFGFYRPYDVDRGGVAPERWHLSYAPLASQFAQAFHEDMLRATLEALSGADRLELQDEVNARLPALVERYVRRVAVAPRAAENYGAGD